MTIQTPTRNHATSSNTTYLAGKPPRKSIKSINNRCKGSKNCPACFKKKCKCTHLQELCTKIGNFKTPMNGFMNRLLFDSFKFDPKDRAKLDAIIINQVNNFTRNISLQACTNETIYKDELDKNFYAPILKQFEKIAISKVEVKADDISVSSEEDSNHSHSSNQDGPIVPQLSIVDDILHSKVNTHIQHPAIIQPKGKLVRIKIGESKEMKSCYLSLENFSSVNQLKQSIAISCNFLPSDIKYESFYDRMFTLCDGYLLDCLKTKFTNSEAAQLILYCK